MGLPKIKHPTFNTTVPSTGISLTLRPFTVREEKILLMAQTSEDIEDMVAAIKQVLHNCIMVEDQSSPISKLATFDIEYLFVKLRAKSVGEVIEVVFTEKFHDLVVNGEEKGTVKYTAEINLDEVEIIIPEDHDKTIKLADDIGIVMNYPSFEQVALMEKKGENPDSVFDMFLDCVDSVFDADGVYTKEDDFTKEELEEFILDLSTDATVKITEFFDTMPTLEHTVTAKDKDGNEKQYTIRGLTDFFTL
jgi:hypothetical protein